MEELHSFQVDKSPSFSFSSSLKPFRMLSRLLCTLLNLWSVSTIRLDSWEIQKLVQNTPSFNPYSCITCYNPCVPLLKFITADDTPMLNVVQPTNIYFGHLFEIILFKYLLLFCAFPCKHVDNSSLIFRFLNTCFNNFLNAVCIPGLCLYVAVPLTISLWYLHHDNSVFGQNWSLSSNDVASRSNGKFHNRKLSTVHWYRTLCVSLAYVCMWRCH